MYPLGYNKGYNFFLDKLKEFRYSTMGLLNLVTIFVIIPP